MISLPMPDADVRYFPQAFSREESDAYLQGLLTEIEWRQEQIKIFGRDIPQPRLSAWYGDANAVYTYSGIVNQPLPWQPLLLAIRQRCEELTDAAFNSVLLNYYRTGQDSMGWHQDNEPELGAQPVIASVSFGASRRFQFRHKKRKDLVPVTIALEHGSLLLMQGATQSFWKHQLPKTTQPVGPRINLTFRLITRPENHQSA
ncbi:MAG: alpha-ketoglutarate-dependent dioxygenase AlkB [Blastocatellia bacterium]